MNKAGLLLRRLALALGGRRRGGGLLLAFGLARLAHNDRCFVRGDEGVGGGGY